MRKRWKQADIETIYSGPDPHVVFLAYVLRLNLL